MQAWDPPPCLPGSVHQTVWARWTQWTYSRPPVCSQESLHYIQSAAEKDISAECMNRRWRPGLASRLCGRLPPHPQPSTHSFHPSPSLCYPPLPPPTPNWLWKMASVSHLGTKIKGKLQPTSMQNVIWKPPSYVLTIDFSLSSSIPSPALCPFLLISPLHFYPSTILRSVKFEEKRPPNPLPDEAKRKCVCVGGVWFGCP